MKFTEVQSKPILGGLYHRFPEPWKISALAEIGGDPVVMAYNNVSRHNSEIWTRAGRIYEDNEAETFGKPTIIGDFAITAGECGRLVYSHRKGNPVAHDFKLGWATTTAIFDGHAVVIDQIDNSKDYVVVRDCLTGAHLFRMPGQYIALDSAVWDGKLWAAIGWDQGLSCSDGSLRRLPMCSCVVNHRNNLFVSSRNFIYMMKNGNLVEVANLPCEKIMDMVSVSEDKLLIAGAKPDTAWWVDKSWNLRTLGIVTEETVDEVGGVCFGWQISEHYLVRTRKGSRVTQGRRTDCGELYPIIWG